MDLLSGFLRVLVLKVNFGSMFMVNVVAIWHLLLKLTRFMKLDICENIFKNAVWILKIRENMMLITFKV